MTAEWSGTPGTRMRLNQTGVDESWVVGEVGHGLDLAGVDAEARHFVVVGAGVGEPAGPCAPASPRQIFISGLCRNGRGFDSELAPVQADLGRHCARPRCGASYGPTALRAQQRSTRLSWI